MQTLSMQRFLWLLEDLVRVRWPVYSASAMLLSHSGRSSPLLSLGTMDGQLLFLLFVERVSLLETLVDTDYMTKNDQSPVPAVILITPHRLSLLQCWTHSFLMIPSLERKTLQSCGNQRIRNFYIILLSWWTKLWPMHGCLTRRKNGQLGWVTIPHPAKYEMR